MDFSNGVFHGALNAILKSAYRFPDQRFFNDGKVLHFGIKGNIMVHTDQIEGGLEPTVFPYLLNPFPSDVDAGLQSPQISPVLLTVFQSHSL
jgi:hypothetical protein